MKTLIEGGWVVAWNGRTHEVHEQGSVVFESERIKWGRNWTCGVKREPEQKCN